MPTYRYRAVSPLGLLVKGRMMAGDPDELAHSLQLLGLDLVRARPSQLGLGLTSQGISRRELVSFFFHLEQLLGAGVPLLQSLNDLQNTLVEGRLGLLCRQMVVSMNGGLPFSEALAQHPEAFNGVVCALVRAGEVSGQLPAMLQRAGELLKWEDELRANLQKLVLYPLFVATVVGVAGLFLLIHVVPQLKLFLVNMGQGLPWHTRLLFAVSDGLRAWGGWLVLGGALGLIIVWRVAAQGQHQLGLDRLKLSLPFFGEIHGKQVMARFATTFANLYGAGVPVLQGLAVARDGVGNHFLAQRLVAVEAAIRQGQGVAEAFAGAGVFPPLVVHMLRVGQTTGGLDTALAQVGYFYHRDIKESIARLEAVLEPSLILLLGGLLMWLALSVLGPIYDVVAKVR